MVELNEILETHIRQYNIHGTRVWCYFLLRAARRHQYALVGPIPLFVQSTKLVHFHWLTIPPRIVAHDPLYEPPKTGMRWCTEKTSPFAEESSTEGAVTG